MKKFKLLIAVFALSSLLLTLAACSQNINPAELDFNKSFNLTARFEYNGRSSTAELTRTSPNEWSGTLSEPFALQGVELVYTPGEMSLSYGGFAFDHGFNASPDANVTAFLTIQALENAFSTDFKTNRESFSSGADWVEITGRVGGDVYILRLDKEGMPSALGISSRQLNVTFSEVRVN